MRGLSFNKIALIFLLIFVALIVFDKIQTSQHKLVNPPKTDTSALGNRLSQYFYVINTKPDDNIAQEHQEHVESIINPELKSFYNSLVWSPNRELSSYKSKHDSTWNQINNDGSKKDNYLKYWQTIRSSMHRVYQQKISKIAVEYPVLHFRCSDSPFNKHINYHMPKASRVKWMAQQIRARGYSKAILISCNQHRSMDQNSCAVYIDFYTKILADAGIELEKQCNSIYQDFAMMVHSPLLVSMSASSFSFMAGVAKNPQDYISCNMGLEKDGKYIRQTAADWILDTQEPLLHKDVADYNNTADVITKLIF